MRFHFFQVGQKFLTDPKFRHYDKLKNYYNIVSGSEKRKELPTDNLLEKVKATLLPSMILKIAELQELQ